MCQKVCKAAVLIHGRTVPGAVVFDLRDPDPFAGAARLSVQKALARAGGQRRSYFGFTTAVCSIIPSTPPKRLSSLTAETEPTPRTPGMLSDLSPVSAL